jgi:carboxymethylenebutenolidase
MGETLSITAADGHRFKGYLAVPEDSRGPSVLILQEIFGVNRHIRGVCDRFAEEGYFALAPDLFARLEAGVELEYDDAGRDRGIQLARRLKADSALADIRAALNAVRALPGASGKAGVVGFCFGGRLAYLTAARTDVAAAVCYYGGGIENHAAEARAIRCPIMMHWGAEDAAITSAARETVRAALAGHDRAEFYVYAEAGHGFNCDQRPNYHRFSASLAHARTLGLLHQTIGPRYDLSALWERHTACEFADRDADATMRTMVAEPYVNHVPTLTGGVGFNDLRRFYRDFFIPGVPADARIVPISRTIGPNRLIDEFLLCFTHDREVPFMAPGVAPTGRYVEVPHVAVVEFRGGKVAHEHIHWDHASFLKQIGVLDAKGLPIAGAEGAKKLVDEKLPTNEWISRWKR